MDTTQSSSGQMDYSVGIEELLKKMELKDIRCAFYDANHIICDVDLMDNRFYHLSIYLLNKFIDSNNEKHKKNATEPRQAHVDKNNNNNNNNNGNNDKNPKNVCRDITNIVSQNNRSTKTKQIKRVVVKSEPQYFDLEQSVAGDHPMRDANNNNQHNNNNNQDRMQVTTNETASTESYIHKINNQTVQLKPCSIVLTKLTDQDIKNLKAKLKKNKKAAPKSVPAVTIKTEPKVRSFPRQCKDKWRKPIFTYKPRKQL